MTMYELATGRPVFVSHAWTELELTEFFINSGIFTDSAFKIFLGISYK